MAGLSRLIRDLHKLPHWSTHSQYEMHIAMHSYLDRMRGATLDCRVKRMQAAMIFQIQYWRDYHNNHLRG